MPKYNQTNKKVELALLYEDLCKLEKEGKIHINPDLQVQLQSESSKSRHHRNSSHLLPPHLRDAAKQLRENENIIVRKADKSSCFVILDKDIYLQKCSDLLKGRTKFKRISRNLVDNLKKKLNKLIYVVNAETGPKFAKVIGDFQPGYFYGNVEIHKEGNPLRPIISQIPTPSYHVAKRLHDIISPYIPRTYSLRSTEEFVDILRVNKTDGILASLDAQNLFTEIPKFHSGAQKETYTFSKTA
ncbi:uncharacterized protein LOC143025998 [Oratosquilla oratoria]|uniref:uncharacterized protein LOC143025998 n=1 Tax=Oratosquilla oratoria TaxID=337810 RepID=UPI003F7696A6